MPAPTRREFILQTAAGMGSAFAGAHEFPALDQVPGDRPAPAKGVKALNPMGRVPVSLIIDDSTCLVNLAHFCIPQFQEVFPSEYHQPWKTLPREIPDSFVRKFGEWCHEHGVKGKFSQVPHPACVGWLDRDMPGWSKRELAESIELVRTLMTPDWDIHPEMVSHTWVIDVKTGRPYPERSDRFMENWRWTDGKSVDELAEYMSYALRILKNVGYTCEGITTPGGFGNRVLPELSQATLQACRELFRAEIPHYFRHIVEGGESVAPRVEYASGLVGDDPKCVVSMIGCTGDWFGGWDGLTRGSVDKFITADLKGGRLPEVIARGEPAILVGHWPGFYFNGEEVGFKILQEISKRLAAVYDNLVWMKLSEIARYWAAKELTKVDRRADEIVFDAPFACPAFTVSFERISKSPPALIVQGERVELERVAKPGSLRSGAYFQDDRGATACFDLPKGRSTLSDREP